MHDDSLDRSDQIDEVVQHRDLDENFRHSQLEQRHQEVFRAAKDAYESTDLAKSNYGWARRICSESAALRFIGGDAISLDKFVTQHNVPLKGWNYPIYDISSSQEIASVKTHWNGKGELDESSIIRYQSDLSKQLGFNREFLALSTDAKNIFLIREAGGPVPFQLSNAGQEEAAVYLRDHSVLRIPDDHVDQVRLAVRASAKEMPDNFYLSNSEISRLDLLSKRIQGIGLTSSELLGIINKG